MKEIFKQYAAYNVWANQRLLEVILNLPAQQQQQTFVSSFPGLQKTLLHMWDAESIWWQRMKLAEPVIVPSFTNPSMKDIAAGLQQQDNEWNEWTASATDADLDHIFTYHNFKKEQFKQPLHQVLLHLFNHSTYHRGQLVTMLRQSGVENIPATDFIVYSRNSH